MKECDAIRIEAELEKLESREEIVGFGYERDLRAALIEEISVLFPNYNIFGDNMEGVEYPIGGRRIDLLLESKDESELLVIELKARKADFKAFGQISMYIGILESKYPNRNVKGVVIAGDVDDSLKHACSITDKISIKTYTMRLELKAW